LITVTITNAIASGVTCQICVIAKDNTANTPPFITTGTYTAPSFANLVTDGDFSVLNITPATSSYTLKCPAPPSPGIYCVGNSAAITNPGNWVQVGNPSPFLYADGSPVAGTNVWCETITGLTINTLYSFSAQFNNIDKPLSFNTYPNMEVLINGTPLLNTGPIPDFPDVWITAAQQWCSNASTTANICIRSTSLATLGNDFAIDNIIFTTGINTTATDIITKAACSCDPNDKLVAPEGCGPEGTIGRNEALTYTIRFENVGTGPANNIIIRDPLDSNLDITTLKILSSSFPITNVEIIPSNVLVLSLDSIELPPLQNSPNNTGYVVFSIMPKLTIPDGTQINNSAGVYFDQNDVVLTNNTVNTIRNNPTPDASFTEAASCANTQSYNFTYTGSTPDNASFAWQFEPDATPSISNVQNPSGILFSSTGKKTAILTVTRFGCTSFFTDTFSVTSADCGKNKVLVCHNGLTICISENALTAHLSHGDCMGNCNNSCDARFRKSVSCSNTQSYDFDYSGNTPDNANFFWQFGPDATPSTSTAQNPSGIVFNSGGEKQATLILTRSGNTGIITDTFSVSSAACGHNKVTVCHYGNPLCISANDLHGHMAHGDCMGNCNTSSSRMGATTEDKKIYLGEIELSLAPNPFTESAVLSFSIPEDDYAEINMYNYLGEMTKNLFAGQVKGNSNQTLTISAKEFSQGIYFLTLRTSKDIKNMKFVLKK
jgi:uncharacterized repeat protein (TIGR01451 family)